MLVKDSENFGDAGVLGGWLAVLHSFFGLLTQDGGVQYYQPDFKPSDIIVLEPQRTLNMVSVLARVVVIIKSW